MHQDQIRAEQETHARQQVDSDEPLSLPEHISSLHRPVLAARKPLPNFEVPKGHEAFLKALEASNATVVFEKASSGEKVSGKIKTSDKHTVSVQTESGTRVIFKHDISEFFAVPRPVTLAVVH